ncbi:hypothetical protein, partial [Paenibacillus terrae]
STSEQTQSRRGDPPATHTAAKYPVRNTAFVRGGPAPRASQAVGPGQGAATGTRGELVPVQPDGRESELIRPAWPGCCRDPRGRLPGQPWLRRQEETVLQRCLVFKRRTGLNRVGRGNVGGASKQSAN